MSFNGQQDERGPEKGHDFTWLHLKVYIKDLNEAANILTDCCFFKLTGSDIIEKVYVMYNKNIALLD